MPVSLLLLPLWLSPGCDEVRPGVPEVAAPGAPRASTLSRGQTPGAPSSELDRHAAAPSAPAASGQPSAARRKRLVFLGDSLTAGYNLAASEAFPARVEALLRAEGVPFEVVNAGVSGDTSAGGLRRLDWLFRRPVDVLFLCLGANDGLRGQSLDALEQNLRAIVQRARSRGATVVLAGMQLPRNYGSEYRDRFAAVYPKLASALALPFLPFLLEGVAGEPSLHQPDGLHPTAAGAERIARSVHRVLSPLLRRLTPP